MWWFAGAVLKKKKMKKIIKGLVDDVAELSELHNRVRGDVDYNTEMIDKIDRKHYRRIAQTNIFIKKSLMYLDKDIEKHIMPVPGEDRWSFVEKEHI